MLENNNVDLKDILLIIVPQFPGSLTSFNKTLIGKLKSLSKLAVFKLASALYLK
jgi:hypothetical protein